MSITSSEGKAKANASNLCFSQEFGGKGSWRRGYSEGYTRDIHEQVARKMIGRKSLNIEIRAKDENNKSENLKIRTPKKYSSGNKRVGEI